MSADACGDGRAAIVEGPSIVHAWIQAKRPNKADTNQKTLYIYINIHMF